MNTTAATSTTPTPDAPSARACPMCHAHPARVPLSERRTPQDRMRRWMLVLIGVSCVGLGALGVFVPGLPTTVFLIIASWCSTKSCPWLEDRLLRNRLLAPYMKYVDRVEPMPRRAKVIAIATMWACVTLSVVLLALSPSVPVWVPFPVIAAAIVGTLVIRRW